MSTANKSYLSILAASLMGTALFIAVPTAASAQPATAEVKADEIGGVVTGAKGPEAGVWVIAETTRSADQIRQDRRRPTIRAAI